MLAASTAAAGATGIRAWLAAKGFSWLTPRRLRAVTIGLIGVALIAASFGLTGA
jgi:hypothetical protein